MLNNENIHIKSSKTEFKKLIFYGFLETTSTLKNWGQGCLVLQIIFSGAYKIPRMVLKRLPWLDWACWKANSSKG
jgi:hypothetical protein